MSAPERFRSLSVDGQPLRQMQRSEHRSFLGLVRVHPLQDAARSDDRVAHKRALVEHHALRALRHRSIRHLSAGRDSGPGHRIEYLSRPDDGDVRGLADPEDLER